MKRWLPSPLLSLALFAMWLLLNASVAPSDLLLGALVAVLAPALLAPLRPASRSVRRPATVARLVARVGGEVVKSALDVARGISRSPWHAPRGQFVEVPLELRDPNALAALAIITSVIPGTIWTELAPDRSSLLLHVFDYDGNHEAFVEHFKSRYERPLKEIFE